MTTNQRDHIAACALCQDVKHSLPTRNAAGLNTLLESCAAALQVPAANEEFCAHHDALLQLIVGEFARRWKVTS